MKTITLSDEAYERLKAWKDSPKDSFSQVVLKSVPKRGTSGDMSEAFKRLAPLDEEEIRLMEEVMAQDGDRVDSPAPWVAADGLQPAGNQ